MTKKFNLTEEDKLRTCGYINFAQVGRPHGLKGAFFLKTEDNRTTWDGYKKLIVETNHGFLEKKVLKTYLSGKALVIVLDGFLNRNEVEPLYNKKIYVHQSEIELKEDEYIVDKLIGFKVYAEDMGLVGTITGISSFGAQDNLEILSTNTKETFLFPFLDKFVKNIDEHNQRIEVIYIPEFFEDNLT